MTQANTLYYKETPGIRNVSTREKFTVIKDTVTTPGVTYEGRCQFPLDEAMLLFGEPVWQLWRSGVKTLIVNEVPFTTGVNNIEGIGERSFKQIWDNRVAIFKDELLATISPLSTNFLGIDDFLNGGDIHKFDVATQFTMIMTLTPQNVSAQRVLIAKSGPAPDVDGYILNHTNTGAIFLQMRTSTVNRDFTFNTTLDTTRQHLVWTFSGNANMNGNRMYRNAVVGNTPTNQSLTGTMLGGFDFLVASRSGTFFYSGLIKDITIWSKAFDQTEVTEHFNNNVIINPNSHSAVANLLSWYRMGNGDVAPTITDNVGSDDLAMQNMDSSNFVLEA